jgi:phosphoglycolate phosphatase
MSCSRRARSGTHAPAGGWRRVQLGAYGLRCESAASARPRSACPCGCMSRSLSPPGEGEWKARPEHPYRTLQRRAPRSLRSPQDHAAIARRSADTRWSWATGMTSGSVRFALRSPHMGGYHLFFDLDGTLTDPGVGITRSLAYAAEHLGRPKLSEVELRRYIGPPLRSAFASILETADPLLIEEAVRLYRERFADIGILENSAYLGIDSALSQLGADGCSLSVVTSKPHLYANRIVEHFGLRRFFANVYGAELSGERSHKSELVADALAGEGALPSRACMIGDREHDIVGANAHGLSSVGVAWGYGSTEELCRAGATRFIHDVAERVPACRQLRRGNV